MSPRLPIDWDATFLGDLPEDPGTSGYPANCGVSGGARILRQVSEKGSIQSIGSLGDIYFVDTGNVGALMSGLTTWSSVEAPNRFSCLR